MTLLRVPFTVIGRLSLWAYAELQELMGRVIR
jgi:hypothetical protein